MAKKGKKGKGQEMSAKSKSKLEKKIIEDKTFGLKNKKKSKKVAQYVQQVKNQVKNRGDPKAARLKAREEEKKKKISKTQAMLASINVSMSKTVSSQKAVKGVNPKFTLCTMFKLGMCKKGDECRFSHDMDIGRKVAKKNVYEDERRKKEEETNANWTEEQLLEVIAKRQSSSNRNRPTEIICKFFLSALEKEKYGWFWKCPNGDDKCQYKHSLPPGYVLKKDKKPLADPDDEDVDLMAILEKERKKLTTRTPITLESFMKWKQDKLDRKKAEEEAAAKKAKSDFKKGKGGLSGRAMWEVDESMFVDDDEGMDAYERVADEDRLDNQEGDDTSATTASGDADKAGAEGSSKAAAAAGGDAASKDKAGIDEDLFAGGDEDLPSSDDDD